MPTLHLYNKRHIQLYNYPTNEHKNKINLPNKVPINLIFIVVNAPPTVSPCVIQSAIKIHCPFSNAFAKRGTITKIEPTPIIIILLKAETKRDHCGLTFC